MVILRRVTASVLGIVAIVAVLIGVYLTHGSHVGLEEQEAMVAAPGQEHARAQADDNVKDEVQPQVSQPVEHDFGATSPPLVPERSPNPLKIRVVDEQGRAVSGCEIVARHASTRELIRAKEHGIGNYQLGGAYAGRWRTSVSRGGFLEVELVLFSPATEVAEVVMYRGGQVSVLVTDLSGAPVSAAEVVLVFPEPKQPSYLVGVTDRSGQVLFEGAPFGIIRITVTADGYADGTGRMVLVDSVESPASTTVRLGRGGTVRVVVAVAEAGPGATLRVLIGSMGYTLADLAWVKATDEHVFEHVPSGPHRVSLYSRHIDSALDHVLQTVDVLVKEGEASTVEFTEPSDDGVSIRGTVRWGDGGLPLTTISITSMDLSVGQFSIRIGSRKGGLFSVQVPGPGLYLVQIIDDFLPGRHGSVTFPLDVPDVSDYEFMASVQLGSVTGLVLDADGLAAQGVVIEAVSSLTTGGPEGTAMYSATTSEEGRVEFSDIAGSRVELSAGGVQLVSGIHMADASLLARGPSSMAVVLHPEGQAGKGFVLHMSHSAMIFGHVECREAVECAGVVIRLRGDSLSVPPSLHFGSEVGPSGYSVIGLPAGVVEVQAKCAQYSSEWREVELEIGHPVQVEFSLGD